MRCRPLLPLCSASFRGSRIPGKKILPHFISGFTWTCLRMRKNQCRLNRMLIGWKFATRASFVSGTFSITQNLTLLLFSLPTTTISPSHSGMSKCRPSQTYPPQCQCPSGSCRIGFLVFHSRIRHTLPGWRNCWRIYLHCCPQWCSGLFRILWRGCGTLWDRKSDAGRIISNH